MKFTRAKLTRSPSYYLFLGVEGFRDRRELYRVLEILCFFLGDGCMGIDICKIPVYLKLALGGF